MMKLCKTSAYFDISASFYKNSRWALYARQGHNFNTF